MPLRHRAARPAVNSASPSAPPTSRSRTVATTPTRTAKPASASSSPPRGGRGPVNAAPARCSEIGGANDRDLPADLVSYIRTGPDAHDHQEVFSLDATTPPSDRIDTITPGSPRTATLFNGLLECFGEEPERGDMSRTDDAEVLAVHCRYLREIQTLGDRDHGCVDDAEGKAHILLNEFRDAREVTFLKSFGDVEAVAAE
jgi:hypothetical protein